MPLNPTVAAVKRNLPRVASSLGFQARVTSAFRSRAKQTALYRRYLQGLQPYPVAPPGTSDHERGLALDIVSTNTEALVSIMAQAGFRWAGPSDPVHFAYIGPQIASQPQKQNIAQYVLSSPVSKVADFWSEFSSDPVQALKNHYERAFEVITSIL